MPEYVVVVRVTAGYLVRVNADKPEQAAATVDHMTLRQVQTEEFFVNTDRETCDVWDTKGNIVLKKV